MCTKHAPCGSWLGAAPSRRGYTMPSGNALASRSRARPNKKLYARRSASTHAIPTTPTRSAGRMRWAKSNRSPPSPAQTQSRLRDGDLPSARGGPGLPRVWRWNKTAQIICPLPPEIDLAVASLDRYHLRTCLLLRPDLMVRVVRAWAAQGRKHHDRSDHCVVQACLRQVRHWRVQHQ